VLASAAFAGELPPSAASSPERPPSMGATDASAPGTAITPPPAPVAGEPACPAPPVEVAPPVPVPALVPPAPPAPLVVGGPLSPAPGLHGGAGCGSRQLPVVQWSRPPEAQKSPTATHHLALSMRLPIAQPAPIPAQRALLSRSLDIALLVSERASRERQRLQISRYLVEISRAGPMNSTAQQSHRFCKQA
jgi:hypothetical protein